MSNIDEEREVLQKRVDLANQVCGVNITLHGNSDKGFSVELLESEFGDNTNYGFAPSLNIALESFLEGMILGCSKSNVEMLERFEQMMESDEE